MAPRTGSSEAAGTRGFASASPPLTGLHWLVAAIRSIATYIVVAGYVAVVAPVALLIARVFHRPDLLFVLGNAGIKLGMATAGIRTRVVGRERLPCDRAAVHCANHQSNIDPPVIFTAVNPRLHILFKTELRKVPLLGRVMLLAGYIPVDRGNRDQTSAAVDAGARSLAAGNPFLIFPEGTRSRTGELLPFKRGGFVMAIKAQVPVVPIAISGARVAMTPGSLIIRPAVVDIRIGKPIETAGLTIDDRDRLATAARDAISQLLAD